MRSFLSVSLFLALATTCALGAPVSPEHHPGEGEPMHQDVDLHFAPPEDLPAVGETLCIDGFAAGYPCANVDLMSFLPLAEMGGGNGSNLWGWTDPLTGKEYALFGGSTGTSFVDISDPSHPVYLGKLPTHSVNSSWRELKAYANHAFIVSEASGHGMQIFDLTQLRSVTNPPVTFSETGHYGAFSNSHTIAVNEETGFAYAAGTNTCSGGLHMINIQNPTSPVFAGCVSSDGYVHDNQCVIYHGPDATYQGREICFNNNEDTITIVDVTTKATPVQISRTGYAGSGYVHQGWLTEDHHYYLQNDELDESNLGHNSRTRVWNMANLDAPQLVGFYDGPTKAIDHNLFIVGSFAYEANYRAGLRILDITNVATASLTQAGYFDIYPTSDTASFNGAWGNFPFFQSGMVIVSGIEQGLYVLRPNLAPDFTLKTGATELGICTPSSAQTTATLEARAGYSGSVTLEAVGLPAGAGASFTVNPVPVPGATQVTITTSGATVAGTYPVTIHGTDGTLAHDKALDLVVAANVPGAAVLVSPPDGAQDAVKLPSVGWSAAPGAEDYLLEVATDPGFAGIVDSFLTSATSHTLTNALVWDTTYYWRVTASNPCGPTASQTFSFRTLPYPPILLVDDDDASPDIQGTYTAALDAMGQRYDVWATGGTDTEPAAGDLAPYRTVLWTTGDSRSGTTGPSAASEGALSVWLDTSRCLLVTSQDYLSMRGLTAFGTGRLGIASFTSNPRYTSVTGQAGSIFAGLGPYTLSFPYANRTDTMIPGAGAAVAFTSPLGNAGLVKDGGHYRTGITGFGVEVLPSTSTQQTVLDRFLDWCSDLATVDGDGDGTANGTDCAPSNPALWASPSEARSLLLSGGPASSLSWSAPDAPGATAVLYDVLRSDTPATFSAATCLESDGADVVASDGNLPAAGSFFSYLVRAQNGCGSNLGTSSAGDAHTGPSCP